jgi:hypothetical protein
MVGELQRARTAEAIRHFHVDGPQRDRPNSSRRRSPSQVLADEQALRRAEQYVLLAQRATDATNRSYAEVWRSRRRRQPRCVANWGSNCRAHRDRAVLDSTPPPPRTTRSRQRDGAP